MFNILNEIRLVKTLQIISATQNIEIFDPFNFEHDDKEISDAEIMKFKSSVRYSVKSHYGLYMRYASGDKYIPHVKYLIHRYNILGLLNNISLSVCPNIKSAWGITHELFGSFFNSNTTGYCSLFPDLEINSLGNALYFKPSRSVGRQMVVLINPPYTTNFIKWTIDRVLLWKGLVKMYVVLPIWDAATRKRLGLSKQPDFPEITSLLNASNSSSTERLTFYDGIRDKRITLKDKVHVIIINRTE